MILGSITLMLLLWPLAAWSATCAPCEEFSTVNTLVRDGRIGKDAAREKIRGLVPALAAYYQQSGAKMYSRGEWAFPLEGYSPDTVGNSKGRDYVASGYDYFSGNRHGGHPSFDLFIRDRNRDCLDDRSNKPVNVLSMTGGLVVALADEWENSSKLRGGKYIWVYDPVEDGLVYYAHNSAVKVAVGAFVKPGDLLATVGRSGLNALKKRSPTHLHLTYLQIRDGYPRPVRISWQWLRIDPPR
jgi:hypothetical protein